LGEDLADTIAPDDEDGMVIVSEDSSETTTYTFDDNQTTTQTTTTSTKGDVSQAQEIPATGTPGIILISSLAGLAGGYTLRKKS
jgi:hypothetical protein